MATLLPRRCPLTIADLDNLADGFAQIHADQRLSRMELHTVLSNLIHMTRRACAQTANDIGAVLAEEKLFELDKLNVQQVYTEIAKALAEMPSERK